MAQDSKTKKVALITGANRGLGLETSRQLARLGYHVILTSRDEAKGRAAAELLRAEKLEVSFVPLDVTQNESVAQAESLVRKEFGRLDVLVNNAGVLIDGHGDRGEGHASALRVPLDDVKRTFETNLFGAYRMCQRFAPLMIRTAEQPASLCRIVNVSSGMGQLSEMNGGYPAYRLSKTALNALTRVFSEELGEHGILVNSICPGWVRTDMGGSDAELTPEQGADTIVWAATLPSGGPTGGFFRERKPIAW